MSPIERAILDVAVLHGLWKKKEEIYDKAWKAQREAKETYDAAQERLVMLLNEEEKPETEEMILQ